MIHFLSVFPPYRGGISSFSDALYQELSSKDEVAAYNFKKLYPPFLFPGRTQFIGNNSSDYSRRILHAYNPFVKFGSGGLPRSSKEDTILYSYWHPFFVPSLRRSISALGKNKAPSYGIFHNVIPHESFPFQHSLIQRLLEKTSGVVLLSNQTEMEFLSLQSNLPYKKLFHPIYEQPDSLLNSENLRKKYGIRPDEQVVLFFGLVRPYKGLDILVDALNKIDLKKMGIRPLIVGEFYSNKENVLSQINLRQSDQFIVIDRFVSGEEMAEVFKLSDITVLPYRSASQSGILSNAINFRVPVIISNLAGLTEHIIHEKHGLILDENTSDCLKDAIIQMLKHTNLTNYYENLDSLKQKLSWKRFTKELNSFFDDAK